MITGLLAIIAAAALVIVAQTPAGGHALRMLRQALRGISTSQ